MAIIIKATVGHAIDRARAMDRYDQLGGHEGIEALLEWYEQYSDDTGETVELDIIAWCCEWSLYDTAAEAVDEMSDEKLEEDEALQYLGDNTSIIQLDSDKLFVMAF